MDFFGGAVAGFTRFGRSVAGAAGSEEAAAAAVPAPEEAYDKREMVEFGCNCQSEGHRGTTKLVGRLQRDLLNSYYWSGNFCTDFLFFVCNWHPLLGLFCSHPAHPWTKKERLATTILSIALSMLPAALLVAVASETDRTDVKLLTGGVVFLAVTLPVIIWEIALYWIVVGDAFCKGRCDMAGSCMAAFQRCCFCASLFCAVVCAFGAMMIVYGSKSTAYKLFLSVATSRVQSWVIWFPIWTFLPYLGYLHCWTGERRAALQVHSTPA